MTLKEGNRQPEKENREGESESQSWMKKSSWKRLNQAGAKLEKTLKTSLEDLENLSSVGAKLRKLEISKKCQGIYLDWMKLK